jgi:hypothetical protein
VLTVLCQLAFGVTAAAAPAAPPSGVDTPLSAAPATHPPAVPAAQRAAVLGDDWRSSKDLAWFTAGDQRGLHVMVATAASGYAWRTAATLSEPGFDADQWIGNACVTGSGRRLVVVYAPRAFTNRAELSGRGGFTAVVDLATGAVRKLAVQTSLAYFNPGCGTGETAVLTQEDDAARTRLLRLDAATARTSAPIESAGQLTSAVPVAGGIAAADRDALVWVDGRGKRSLLSPAKGVPYELTPDAGGGLVYLDRTGGAPTARRVAGLVTGRQPVTAATTLATGAPDLRRGTGGAVFVTGKVTVAGALPSAVRRLDVAARAETSTTGRLAVTEVRRADNPDPRTPVNDPSLPRMLNVSAAALTTGKPVTFTVDPAAHPAAGGGNLPSPALAGGVKQAASPTDPIDTDRWCSVPRNDPANQAYQPKPRQVEWAVDQAVRGALTVSRPANWKNLGMPAYTPQGLLPRPGLDGGGFVPAQIMLGILAQESNLWQASSVALPGVTANPLVGNFYGRSIYDDNPADDWDIHWDESDCGYGLSQVTDGMRLAGHEKPGETARPYQTQRAIGLDFAANVAAGLQILEGKWNEVKRAGLFVNDGDPQYIENWFFAAWAYNSGFHPDAHDGAAWGVGWANNPANPRFLPGREPFLEYGYDDARHPQDWPYPEKVIGWAGHPIEALEAPDTIVSGYRQAWWNSVSDRIGAKPLPERFCNNNNSCDINGSYPNDLGEPAGPCMRRDLTCWYHTPVVWKSDCAQQCGHELLRFDPGYAYQDDGTSYPPLCNLTGLPADARIIDDVPDNAPVVRPDCSGHPWHNAGKLTLTFAASGATYPSKVDTHQIGGGFGGHFWFAHTQGPNGAMLGVSADWKASESYSGPMKVYVALPDHGAQTPAAHYVVKTARGDRHRVISQPGQGNRWVPIGTFMFDGVPEVTLDNSTPTGTGDDDIAFDAVAFAPVAGDFHEETVEAVAEFDEDQNIDADIPGSWLGGPLSSATDLRDWGVETTDDILSMGDCPPETVGDCLLPGTRHAMAAWRAEIDLAGDDPVNHPDGHSVGDWIGFAQPFTDRPATDQRPAAFDDDNRYKIKNSATVSFVSDPNGHVVPGSEYVTYDNRTGNTHLPRFVRDLFQALSSDYAISPPDLRYTMPDLNARDGVWRTADPVRTGALPGRQYAWGGKAPVLVNAAGAPSSTDATCVRALTASGGSIGYRPMLSQSGPTDKFDDWVTTIEDDDATPGPVKDLVSDIQDMFFNPGGIPGGDASIFRAAPPIWQQLDFEACADGTVRRSADVAGGSSPVLRASYMPDEYLYHNGRAIDLNGTDTGASRPILTGDFRRFSHDPYAHPEENPYGACDPVRGDRTGNPWNLTFDDGAGADPPFNTFCHDRAAKPDPGYTG